MGVNQEYQVKKIEFLHASDLHLGSAQFRNLDRAYDYVTIFDQILAYGRNKKVDVILLGGDVFTSIDIIPDLFQKIVHSLENFRESSSKDIPIVAIEGNHDLRRYSHHMKYERGQSWLKILADLGYIYLLGAKHDSSKLNFSFSYKRKQYSGPFKLNWMEIYGTPYQEQVPRNMLHLIQDSMSIDPRNYRILLQHFGILGQMKGVPGVSPSEIRKLFPFFNYIALGHFHKGFQLENRIFNPGCPEAVSPSEQFFTRGIFHGIISKNDSENESSFQTEIQLISLNNRSLPRITITLSKKYSDLNEFIRYIIKRLRTNLSQKTVTFNQKSKPYIYLILKGMAPSSKIALKESMISSKLAESLPIMGVRKNG